VVEASGAAADKAAGLSNVVVPLCVLGHDDEASGAAAGKAAGLKKVVVPLCVLGHDAAGKAAGLTFVQGLLISLNFNLGFSALMFPIMVATAGWISTLLLACAFVTLMTAKFLAIRMNRMPEVKTFSDIGLYAARKASGGSKRDEGVAKVALALFQSFNLFFCLLFGVVSVQGALVLLVPKLSAIVAFVVLDAGSQLLSVGRDAASCRPSTRPLEAGLM
jgi:hypothetical protein